MSHISVRLMYAVLAPVVAAVVGGSAQQTDQPAELTARPQPVAQQSVRISDTPKQVLPVLDRQQSECSAPIEGEGVSQVLERLVRVMQPHLPMQRVSQLTEGPHGSLFIDAIARNPQGPDVPLNVADTICVIRSYDGREAVWYVHFPGYYDRTASR